MTAAWGRSAWRGIFASICLGAVLATLLVALGPARQAWAHASLLSAQPADGETIPAPPATLRLEFNEPVSPLVMRLVRPSGQVLALTKVTAKNNVVTVSPPPLPELGTYVLSWRVISADGHPVGGVVSFAIGHPSSGVSAPPVVGVKAVHAAIWVVQLLISIALFVGVGGAVFAAWLAAARPMPGQKFLAAIMACGVIAAFVSLPLQGLDALALPLADVGQPQVWAAGYETSWGTTVLIALAALALGSLALKVESRFAAKLLAALAIAAIGFAYSASGHASSTPPLFLNTPAVFLHAVCVTLWVGALLPLATTLRSGDRLGLERFSRMIPGPLVALIATGIILAVSSLDRPDALWTTAYGIVLSAKLALVLVLLMLGAANRYALVPGLAKTGTRRLIRVIATEFALAIVILGVVGLWRFTTPPRALDAAETTYIHFHSERAMAQIDLRPVRGRGAEVSIAVTDADLRPIAAKEVALVIWNPAEGIEPIRRNATFAGGAQWHIDGFVIPVAGVWRMRVEILIDDFDKVLIEDNVELPRAP